MNVIINGRFLTHRTTGVERYAREILLELDRIIQPGEIKIAIPPEVKEIPNYNNITVLRVGKLKNILWEHISFPIFVLKNRGISLNLCNVAPLIIPGIVSIFDTKIREHPEFFSKKFVLWYRLLFWNETKRAKIIFTDSLSAKNEILRYYNVPDYKIVVVPCAWQHFERIGCDESALIKYNLEKDNFFFAMGSADPNKNFRWIAEVAKKNPDDIFAVAGPVNDAVFVEGFGFERPDNMKLIGYVSDEEAKTLMRDCRAFLFPSFCEGFGMPPMEALCAGANAIVVSDIPVMHELFEDYATYINPHGEAEKIVINRISDFGRIKILKKYSWELSALKIYQNIKAIE